MTTTPQSFTAAPSQPVVAFDVVAFTARDRARKWRDALAPVLERKDHPLLSAGEIEAMAVDAATRVFGKKKSARHVRRMIKNVTDRDGGRRQFHHEVLYLEKCPALVQSVARPLAPVVGGVFAELRGASAGFTNPVEVESYLRRAWNCEQRLLLRGGKPKAVRAELVRFLCDHAPWLSETHRGIVEKIGRRFRCYEQHECEPRAMLDGNAARAGESRSPAFPQEHLDIITHTAYHRGGRVAQAMDDLVAEADKLDLPESLVEFILTHRGKGSQVNRRLLDAVLPEVKTLKTFLLGKQAIDDITPALRRSYSKLRSMTVVTADDYTLNAYFTVPDGKGWFTLTRGQVLLFIDVRSRRIISWVLIPERNYDGLQIATGMRTVCLKYGIPSFWDFEMGIWKRSSVVKSLAPAKWTSAFSGEAFQGGWENLGSHIRHARRARSKPAELVGGLLQRLMDGCRGASGHNEMDDLPEETRKAKLLFETLHFRRDVEAGRIPIDKHFDTFEQWEKRLAEFIDRYNARPQGGLLGNKSPDQVFEEQWNHEDPPTEFNESVAFNCASYKHDKPYLIRDTSINFSIGRNKFFFGGNNISDLRNRYVDLRFDPCVPEVLLVSEAGDRDGSTARFVSRIEDADYLATVDPDSTEAEHYRQQVAKVNGFMSHPKARFHALEAKFKPTFRKVITDRKTAALAVTLQQGRTAAIEQQRDEDNLRSRIERKARDLGLDTRTLSDFSEETELSLARRLKRRKQLTQE